MFYYILHDTPERGSFYQIDVRNSISSMRHVGLGVLPPDCRKTFNLKHFKAGCHTLPLVTFTVGKKGERKDTNTSDVAKCGVNIRETTNIKQ